MSLSGVLKVATNKWTPLPRGDGTVKLEGARLSCQGRYLPRGPHSSPPHPFFSLHSFPFLDVWVSTHRPLSSILSSNSLLLYWYLAPRPPRPSYLHLPVHSLLYLPLTCPYPLAPFFLLLFCLCFSLPSQIFSLSPSSLALLLTEHQFSVLPHPTSHTFPLLWAPVFGQDEWAI